MMTFLSKPLLAVTVGLTLISGPAFAQDTNSGQTYEPAFFEQYAPRTALDMVRRIPGFQIQREDNKRGLGQGGANVLINGERISGKTDARDQLSRINAGNVVKIEIVDGTSLDIPGLSGQVANVFSKTTGVTGTWEWTPEWRNGLEPSLLRGSVSVSGESGKLSYSAKLDSDMFRNGHWGPERQFTPDGTVFETRDEGSRFNGENPGASLDLSWKPKEDHVANLNLEFNLFNFNGREISKRMALTPRGRDLETHFFRGEDEWNAEAGGDYEFPAGPGKLKLIGYYRTEHSPTASQFDVYDPQAGLIKSSQFNQIADEGETIGRAEYSWSPQEGRDWQLGLEGAFNVLDFESEFIDLFTPANNGTDASRVEEKRAEATLTHSRKLSPKWDVQISAGGEYSEISQNTGLSRQFFRPKGFISATYKPVESLSIRSKVEREVGQLDFFDFISSVDLQGVQNNTGNANLVPEQSWLAEVEFDKDFGNGNTFKARFYGALISDLVDRIPIETDDDTVGDAVGNIDSAKRYGVEFTATIKGDKWDWNGTQLDLELQLQKSAVDDPLLGFSRRLNGDTISSWSASFRHDIPKSNWAYGAYIQQSRDAPRYRLNTINQFTFDGPWSEVFIEHKDVLGMKVQASLQNLFDASDDFRREIFTKRRDLGVLDFTEERTRPFGLFLALEVSDTF